MTAIKYTYSHCVDYPLYDAPEEAAWDDLAACVLSCPRFTAGANHD